MLYSDMLHYVYYNIIYIYIYIYKYIGALA